jgi:hypothetical protein
MAASKTIGGINVTITATIDKFKKSMTMVQKITTATVRKIKDLTFSLKGLAAAFTIGAATKWLANRMAEVDALGELSDKLGVATDKLVGYQLAAQMSGISNTVLEKSLTTLSAKGMSLRDWVEQTAKFSTHQERLNATIGDFGTRSANMVRLVADGVEGLDAWQKKAEALGLSLSHKTVAAVQQAADAFDLMKRAISGVGWQTIARLAPHITAMANAVTDFMADEERVKRWGKAIGDFLIDQFARFLDIVQQAVAAVRELVAEIQRIRNFGQMSGKDQLSLFNNLNPMNWVMDAWQQTRVGLSGRGSRPAGGAASAGAPAESWGEQFRRRASDIFANLKVTPPAGRDFWQAFGGNLAETPLLQGIRDVGGKGLMGLGNGINGFPGMLMKAWLASGQFAAAKGGKPGMALGSLSALDPLSREGNSQRVRSLAANKMQKIGEQQLAKQEQMEKHLAKIAQNPVVLKPANI